MVHILLSTLYSLPLYQPLWVISTVGFSSPGQPLPFLLSGRGKCLYVVCTLYLFFCQCQYVYTNFRQSLGDKVGVDEQSWIGSLGNMGILTGTILSWLITKFLSARIALINTSLGIVLGWVLVFTGAKTSLLILVYLGLFITGTMCGLTSPLSSIYITELAGTGQKGVLASMMSFNVNFGILFISILGSWIG